MTRAKEEVYLIWSSRRRIFGNLQINTSSRFLDEIPSDLKQEIELDAFKEESDEKKKKIDPDNPEIELFDDGDYEF